MITETTVDEDGVEHEEVRHFQKPDGRLPLSPVDTDTRWRTSRRGKPSGLHYQENVMVDLGGFIHSRGVSHAPEGEWKAVPALLEGLPLQPVSLAADTGYVGAIHPVSSMDGVGGLPSFVASPPRK